MSGTVNKTFDQADKASAAADGVEVGAEGTYALMITELDMETGSCKVQTEDAPADRFSGRITDPGFTLPNNPYVMAMADRRYIKVRGKPTLRDGEIDKLYISDIA